MEQPAIIDEKELLLRLSKGDEAAFEELYACYAPQLIDFELPVFDETGYKKNEQSSLVHLQSR